MKPFRKTPHGSSRSWFPEVEIDTQNSFPLGEKYNISRADVSINAKDLSFDELQTIYYGIRNSLGLTKSKALNHKHLRLYQMVKASGNPPTTGTIKYWTQIQENLNGEYGTWKGVQKAYNRIMQKLEERFESD